jgi:hypothetical protein
VRSAEQTRPARSTGGELQARRARLFAARTRGLSIPNYLRMAGNRILSGVPLLKLNAGCRPTPALHGWPMNGNNAATTVIRNVKLSGAQRGLRSARVNKANGLNALLCLFHWLSQDNASLSCAGNQHQH